MKTNLYRMIGVGRAMAAAVVLVSLMFGFEACKTDPVSNSYVKLGYLDEESDEISIPVTGQEKPLWFNLYSDHSAWTVEVDYLYDADLNWITVWPNKGSGDGRFGITVNENKDTPYLREANVNIISNGTVIRTVNVKQEAVAPRLKLGMEGLTRLTFSSKAAEKTAILNTNTLWRAEITSMSEEGWLSLTDFSEQAQSISVTANTGTAERTAVIRFTMVGGTGELFVDLDIKQRDSSTDAEFATLTTIEDILNQLGPGGGEITENVYIDGYVTSDLSTRNFDVKRQWPVTDATSEFDQAINYEKRFMWVQDEGEKGMMFEWLSGTYNIYELNTNVKIHLIGCTVVTDAFTGAPKIGNVEPDMVFESQASDGIAPVELNSFDNIADYVNTLVKISPVQFALPYGTYVNINEGYFNEKFTDDATRYAVPYCETSRQYGHLIMDGNGNTCRLVTECTFTERYIRSMPQGSGALTAIVTKNYLAGENHYVLRLRSDSDNEISEDASTRLTKIVSRFGPYEYNASRISNVTATEGNGSMKTGVSTSISSSSSDGVMYWSSTYARFITTGITIDEKGAQSPDIPQSENIYTSAYACVNSANIWNPSLASSIADSRLGGWIFTLSTVGVTGDLYLTFDSSSSAAGPAWMRLQWKEIVDPNDEFTTKDQWNTIVSRYELPNWNTNLHMHQYSFKLPDELKGRNKIIIRHITDFEADGTTAPARATRIPGTTASNGGTNRFGLWTLEEIK